jgi:DNA-binding XRE family transcriptional regulator
MVNSYKIYLSFLSPNGGMLMLYCAIIGDIIGSRKLKDRQMVQREFIAMAKEASNLYKAEIQSPFTVTIGDEFQALLKSLVVIPNIIEHVVQRMAPVELVFGLGIGPIHTDINPKMAIGMDGPAFHLARQALLQAKKKKPRIIYHSEMIGVDMINALNYFIESCEARRTKRQKEVLSYVSQNYTQEAIAKALGITQQSVHDIISASYLPEIAEAKRTIAKYLIGIAKADGISKKDQL